MTLPPAELDTAFTTLSNIEKLDAAAEKMELVIRTSGRGATLQPTRFCYPYGHESRKRREASYPASGERGGQMCDKKKAQIAEGKF